MNNKAKPSSPLKLAVFDCDGTLVDSLHSIVTSMDSAFEAHGLPRPGPDKVKRIVGLPLDTAVAILAPELDEKAVTSVREGYRDFFLDLRRKDEVHEPLFPGALEAIERLEGDGWLLGVATGKGYQGLLHTLSSHGLEKRFVTLQTADKAPGKPHPGMLMNAMTEAGVENVDTVMIGDTTFDMEMAVNAGTLALGVAWGYHEEDELRSTGASSVIRSFDELYGCMQDMMENEK